MLSASNGNTPADTFLDDIKQLFERGELDDAFELLDAHLAEHPGDTEAELLKVELCFNADRQAAFVGQTLPRLEQALSGDERVTALRERVNERVKQKLAEGRRMLRGRYGRDAARMLEVAVALAPGDAAVTLAAGLTLLGKEGPQRNDRNDDDDSSPFGRLNSILSSRSTPSPSSDAGAKYLQLALTHSAPDSRVHTLAAEHLVRHWVARDKVDEAAKLLESIPQSGPVVSQLAADVANQMLGSALDVTAALLKADQLALADRVLKACAAAGPGIAWLELVQAEAHLLGNRPDKALAAYRRVVKHAGHPPASLPAARSAWELAKNSRITCAYCGTENGAEESACEVCEQPFGQHQLLMDRYHLADAEAVNIAQVGMAELLAARGQTAEALPWLDRALAALPKDHRGLSDLQNLRRQWQSQNGKPPENTPPAPAVISDWQNQGLTPEVRSRISQIARDDWAAVPFVDRRNLVRALIAAQHFDLARTLLAAAFTDNPKRKTMTRLGDELRQAIQVKVEAETQRAREALAAGHAEQAAHLAETALALNPQHHPARLVRAEARCAVGQDVLALADFRLMMEKVDDPALCYAARLGAARTLEGRHDYEEALAVLGSLDDPEARTLRARLQRQQRGEPEVHLQRVNSVVMHDTLTRAAADPHYQGFFGVALRAARRPWNISLADWNERIWSAGFEFVQVLGGLRNFVGDPTFALRIISHPHPQIPERGHLTIAILARVSAPDSEACRELALNLWWTISSVLPLAQDFVYAFQPVVDENELKSLLNPFEAANIAEIVRREDVPLQEDDRYAIYPFTAGSADLQNVCWTLLRQKTPAMISVHLLPTDLMAWERAAFDKIMLSERAPASGMSLDAGQIGFVDPVSQWWQGIPQWGRAQANRRLVDTLRAQAYVLRVTVAGSAGSSALLPEIVAATMFGPLRPVNDALFGGYEIIRASRTDEFEVARENLATINSEGWMYTAAPEGAARLRHLFGESEAAVVFRLPIPAGQGIPGVPVMEVKPVAPPSNLPVRGVMWGESVARVGGGSLYVTQSTDDRRRHAYIVGKTGTGKSTLLKNLALQDIEAGHGVCIIDPHNDLIEDILARIPPHRVDDVIIFDPSDEAYPVGLNLMEARTDTERHRIVTEFIGLLVRMYDPMQQGIVGPRFQHNVRNAMLTAMCTDESTLIEVVRALTDIQYVKKILPRITDPLVRNYWEKQIPQTSDFHKSEILDYLVSKFSRFVGDHRVRNIIGQKHTTVDFRDVMDQRRILLVNLAKGKIGPESAQFLGLLLVQRLLITALSRADQPPDQRPDFFLYVDEFQNFATDLFATVLSEGRKYGVAVTVANQYLTQLDHNIRESIFGNVGSIISFRLGTQDAAILAPEMYPAFGPDDLLNLPKYTTCTKLLVDGVAARPFTMRTVLDTRPPNPQRAEAIRQMSREKYGRDATAVSEDVLARFTAIY